MIVVKRKNIDAIKNMVGNHSNVLILGCDGCAGIMQEGGKRQADLLAMGLEMKRQLETDEELKVETNTVLRQCDKTVILSTARAFHETVKKSDVIISLGCGAGVQTLAEMFPQKIIVPGTDTLFIGAQERDFRTHIELCRACGDCILFDTGGVCPITRCAKGLMNGPCGGVIDGKCEVGNYTKDCAWFLIWKRLKELGQLERFTKIRPPRNFSQSMGAPREFKYSGSTEAAMK
ncbi:MAG: methylenetetrahydrofolate reductase C-terminal domain-containing protein [Candidatus Heimdallarchaeota archaeon]